MNILGTLLFQSAYMLFFFCFLKGAGQQYQRLVSSGYHKRGKAWAVTVSASSVIDPELVGNTSGKERMVGFPCFVAVKAPSVDAS